MNWCSQTQDPQSVASWMNSDCADMCEHVESNKAAAFGLFKEDDSFGPVMRRVVCKGCWNKHHEEEANKTRHCSDCKMKVKQKDGCEWRWHDFYAAQGDVALFICDKCWSSEGHKNRMAIDREEGERESNHHAGYGWITNEEVQEKLDEDEEEMRREAEYEDKERAIAKAEPKKWVYDDYHGLITREAAWEWVYTTDEVQCMDENTEETVTRRSSHI